MIKTLVIAFTFAASSGVLGVWFGLIVATRALEPKLEDAGKRVAQWEAKSNSWEAKAKVWESTSANSEAVADRYRKIVDSTASVRERDAEKRTAQWKAKDAQNYPLARQWREAYEKLAKTCGTVNQQSSGPNSPNISRGDGSSVVINGKDEK